MAVSTKRLTTKEVSDFIKNNNCELLEEYINNRQKLLIKCKCGNLFRTSFKEFKGMNKRQCNECGKKIAREKLKNNKYNGKNKILSYEEVKERFKKYGHIMVWSKEEFEEKYKNYKTLIKLQCNCGNYYYKNIADIKRTVNNMCDECKKKKGNIVSRKYTEEEVKNIIEFNGGKLLSKYTVTNNKIIVQCKCGNEYTTTIDSFMNSKYKSCKKCTALEGSKKRRLKIDEVKEIIESEKEYKLLSNEYINNRTKLNIFHTKCGKEFKCAFDMFQRGDRCPYCYNSKGEEKIKKWLEENNKIFKMQYTFDDLLGTGGRKLRYDFAVLNDDGSIKFLIEYDGELHYKPYRKIDSAMDKLKRTQIHDEMKNNYCRKNNIKLIRIKYTEFKNIENILEALF